MPLLLNNNVGYTVVGNPTIIDGIVSDFTTNDYVKIILPSSIQKLEFNTVLTISNTNWQNLFNLGCDAYINGGSGQCVFRYTNTLNQTSYKFVGSISTNIPVSFNIHINNNILVLNVIQNEQTIYSNTVNDFLISSLRSDFTFSGSDPLSGTLNLNKTYIKVNEVTWFNGKQNASTNINKVFYNNNIGYTIVGSPTINNGVVSGFSNSNYLTLPTLDLSQAFEILIKIKTPATWGNTYDIVLNSNASSANRLSIQKDGSNKRLMYRIPRYDEQTYATYYSGELQEDTIYYIKIAYDGTKIVMQHSLDNSTWVTDSTELNRTPGLPKRGYSIGRNANLQQQAWNGSIDLNETYIKINGITWFNGKEQTSIDVNYLVLNGGKTGYTVVGSPIINSGIMTNTSYEDYAKTSSALDLTSNSKLEFNIRFKTPETLEGGFRTLFSPDVWDSPIIMVTSSTNNYYLAGYAGDLYQISLNNNTYYRAKLVKSANSNIWTIYCYDDNGQLLGSTSGETVATQNKPILIGASYGSASPAIQAIDLNNTYIKVNNEFWFNGGSKLVWANPNIYLQGDGNSCILTDYAPSYKTSMDIKVGDVNNWIWGARNSVGTIDFGIAYYLATFGKNVLEFQNISSSAYTFHYGQTLIINGETIGTFPETSSVGNVKMLLFGIRTEDNNNIQLSSGKIYYCKIYDDSELLYHFVPVPQGLILGNSYLAPSNGMFDIVEQKFYPNLGTGIFNIGKD